MTLDTHIAPETAHEQQHPAVADRPADDAATAAVREVFRRVYAAWSDNDADAFVALYRHDATVVMPKVLHRNRNEIHAAMAASFRGALKGSRAVDEPLSIRIVAGDTAIVVSRAGIIMAGDDELLAEREVHATWVLTRQDGEWLVAAYANAPAR